MRKKKYFFLVLGVANLIDMYIFALTNFADMVKLVDMPDLGSGAARRVGSSPIIRTETLNYSVFKGFFMLGCKIFTG